MTISALYLNTIWEVRKSIMARGLTMEECDALSGNQEGYTAKLLNPESDSGRQATWDTLDNLIMAVFKGGYRIRIKPVATFTYQMAPVRGTRSIAHGKVTMRDFAPFAARKANANRSPVKLSAAGRKAARARWKDKKQPKWKRRILARKAKRARERRARKGDAT